MLTSGLPAKAYSPAISDASLVMTIRITNIKHRAILPQVSAFPSPVSTTIPASRGWMATQCLTGTFSNLEPGLIIHSLSHPLSTMMLSCQSIPATLAA